MSTLTPDTPVTTAPFLTTSGDYFSVLLSAWLPRYGWILALPIIAFAVIGYILQDERWMLVALMLLFIVMPMAMSFLYTYYMLTPEARRSVLRKRVVIVPGNYLRLEYLPDDDKSSGENALHEQDLASSGTKNPENRTTFVAHVPETIPWEQIVKIKSTSRFRVYCLTGERMQFLLIPWSALHPANTGEHSDSMTPTNQSSTST